MAVNFSKPSYEVMESGTVTITIVLSQPSSKPFNVAVKTVNVTAFGRFVLYIATCLIYVDIYIAGKDFIGGTRNVSIPAGKSMVNFTVDTIISEMVECDETFNISIISVTTCGVTIGSNNNSKVIIKDNDGE